MPICRVVVVDDHELLRAGTRRILEEAVGFSVVGEAGDGNAALQVIGETGPDVVLVDIRLPVMNGIDLARRIGPDFPKTTVLILSAYDDEDYVRAALAAGVSGYLLKTMPGDELVRSIRAAADGSSILEHPLAGHGEKSDGPGRRRTATDGTRIGSSPSRRPRHVEQGHRQPTRHQPANRGRPRQSRVRQTGHQLPH